MIQTISQCIPELKEITPNVEQTIPEQLTFTENHAIDVRVRKTPSVSYIETSVTAMTVDVYFVNVFIRKTCEWFVNS